MNVEVILPYRGGCEHRSAALAWALGRYPWPVTIASCPPGPWCKAAAVTPAAEASSAEVLVVADADAWCDGTELAVQAVIDGHPWAIPHTRVHRLTLAATTGMLAGREPDPAYRVEERPYRGVMGGGIVVLPRETYLCCPLDPRFTGWGQEDLSWGLALTTLAGTRWRGKADLIHLWHPPQPRMSRKTGSPEGAALHRRYKLAHNDPAAMSRLIEEARQCPSPVS